MRVLLLTLLMVGPASVQAVAFDEDEWRATGGEGTALLHGGVAGPLNLSSPRINPALMMNKRRYSAGGSFTRPRGKEAFAQITVMDSWTSQLGVGLTWRRPVKDAEEGEWSLPERFQLILARRSDRLGLGLAVNRSKAVVMEDGLPVQVTVTSGSLGLSGDLRSGLRWGISWQNWQNQGYHQVDAETMRAGLGWTIREGVLLMLDGVSRAPSPGVGKNKRDNGAILSMQADLPGQLIMLASIGSSSENDGAAGAGLGWQGDKARFALNWSRPDLSRAETVTTLSLNLILREEKR